MSHLKLPDYLFDVRSKEQFKNKAFRPFEGAINVQPHEIAKYVQAKDISKDALIAVYSRFGQESENARLELALIGYMNMRDPGKWDEATEQLAKERVFTVYREALWWNLKDGQVDQDMIERFINNQLDSVEKEYAMYTTTIANRLRQLNK
jgi:rhodanese-related sulfurtransferase